MAGAFPPQRDFNSTDLQVGMVLAVVLEARARGGTVLRIPRTWIDRMMLSKEGHLTASKFLPRVHANPQQITTAYIQGASIPHRQILITSDTG